MRYLVTGSAGFIGFHVCRTLLRAGHEVVGFDSVNNYYRQDLKEERLTILEAEGANAPGRFRFFRGLLEDSDLLATAFACGPFSAVIHLAAQAGVRYSTTHPQAYLSSNLEGFLSILELCRTFSVPHLAFASSSSVYGLNRTVPFSENHSTDHTVSLYAATKKANEVMAHTYSHLYGIPATGMRFFTVYGPYGRPDMAYFKFADAIMRGETIDIYNNGDLLRDFTYIDDVVRAIIMIADRPAQPDALFDPNNPLPASSSAPFTLYNIGNAAPEPLELFIDYLENLLGKKAIKRYLPMQAGDVYMTAADTSRLEKDFSWKPHTPLAEGLASFTDWYKERKPWLQ